MILTNAAAKRDFYLIQHFGVKMSPVPRHTQHQYVLGIKIVASSCPASSRLRQAVLLRSEMPDCELKYRIVVKAMSN